MLIDTHCHVDQFPDPEAVVRKCRAFPIKVVAVTNLPSHYEMAVTHLRGQSIVVPALGMHPLYAQQGIRELSDFRRLADSANFIGEVGLDFSRTGITTKTLQERLFDEVLRTIHNRPRFLTIHSRGAEKSVLEGLARHDIKNAVFHWFTGPVTLLEDVFKAGHLVSLNVSAVATRYGRDILANAPRDSVLVESDGPFAKVHGKPACPTSVTLVYEALSQEWGIAYNAAVDLVHKNFTRIQNSFSK